MNKTSPMKSKPLVDVTCKLGAKGCFEDGRCHALGDCENKIVTNADRLRAMSDEELAGYVVCPHLDGQGCTEQEGCVQCCLKWLQEPVKEGSA